MLTAGRMQPVCKSTTEGCHRLAEPPLVISSTAAAVTHCQNRLRVRTCPSTSASMRWCDADAGSAPAPVRRHTISSPANVCWPHGRHSMLSPLTAAKLRQKPKTKKHCGKTPPIKPGMRQGSDRTVVQSLPLRQAYHQACHCICILSGPGMDAYASRSAKASQCAAAG